MAWAAHDQPAATSTLVDLAPGAITHSADLIAKSSQVCVLQVVIVNYCQWENTAALTRQLRESPLVKQGRVRIVIIDNHSPRHPQADALAGLSGVRVIHARRNLGFARAVNMAASATQSPWLLCLNPDVSIHGAFLDEVVQRIDHYAGCAVTPGVVGFRLENSDRTEQASAGPYPTLWNTLAGLCLPRARRKCRLQPRESITSVDWVTGGCLLVQRQCYQQLRGLDDRYFLYYEDVDFCRRAREQGFEVWYDPAVAVTHHSPLHTRKVEAPLRVVTRHALLMYARKFWPKLHFRLLSRLVSWESRLRRWNAWRKNRWLERRCYAELEAMTRDILTNQIPSARKRLRKTTSLLGPIAMAQDRPGT